MQHELITSEGLGTAGSQRRHLLRSVSECKWALNYMHGEPHRSQVVAASKGVELDKLLDLQRQTQLHLEKACYTALESECASRPIEAWQTLLRDRSPYSSLSSTTVVPCQVSRVVLPTSAVGAADVVGSVREQVRKFLDDGALRMLRSAVEVRMLSETKGDASTHMDPTRLQNPRKYAKIIKEVS